MSNIVEELTINQTQLKILTDSLNCEILACFSQEQGPSDAARALNMSANTLHYRVHKLLDAGLLQETQRQGRVKSYQLSAKRFLIPQNLLNEMGQQLPNLLDKELDALKVKLRQSREKSLHDVLESNFDQNQNFFDPQAGIAAMQESPLLVKPLLLFAGLHLEPAQFTELSNELEELFKRYAQQSNANSSTARHCSVNLVCFEKVA